MQIIWFAEIKWDYLKTRKQQIITRKPADTEVLYLEPYTRGRSNAFQVRTEGNLSIATIPFIKSAPTVLWRYVLDRRAARRAIDLLARTRIRDIVKKLHFEPHGVGFITSNIYAADIAVSLPRKFLVYDCNDDHSAFPGMRAWSEAYFTKTCRHADAVFASSRALLERVTAVRGGGEGLTYLGNGVDFDRFQTANGRPPQGRVRLGYVGALAPWFDFEAVADLSRRHPDWEIVLVGPVLHGAEGDVSKLASLPNVSRLAAVSYEQLPAILSEFSIGLIPFRLNRLTRGVNPNKLYEYLAAGLPVVATPFSEEVQKYPDVVKAVRAGEEFSAACTQVVAQLSNEQRAREIRESARRTARENDWSLIARAFWSKVGAMIEVT